MRTARTIVLASLASLTAILGATVFMRQGPVYSWVNFYVWRWIAGNAHGGHYVAINDIVTYYETYGTGPPVLVLHGGMGSIASMSNQIHALAKSHFVIAADSRSHGRTTDSSAPLSYALMADDMLKLLDHLKIDRVDIVGWSDGAIIGLDLAMHHPERIGRLVAIGANYDVDGAVPSSASLSDIPPVPLSYKLVSRDPAHWPALYREVHTMWKAEPHYTLDDLARVRAPTLLVVGEFDAVKPEHTAQFAKAVPSSEVAIIPGATHNSPLEKPEIVNRHMLRFLDGQPAGDAK
jgi:pimeloyl-ACP methyl ester carboxylesterase